MKSVFSHNIVTLVLAVVVGILLGKYVESTPLLAVAQCLKAITSQVIFFLVPLIVLAFVASAVTSIRSGGATRLFLFCFVVAYISSEASAAFSLLMSYTVVPLLNPEPLTAARALPDVVFTFSIPPVMNVISALFMAIFLGLGIVWTGADTLRRLLDELREVMMLLVKRVMLPILPIYIGCNFYIMAWQGSIDSLVVLLPVIAILVVAQLLWVVVLYVVASVYSRKNAFEVLRHYMPAYLTAFGTMSSAATIGVALQCARSSRVLQPEVAAFTVPLFANIHLCGSTLTETFFLAVVAQLLYGQLPDVTTFLLFIVLLAIFAVGAPGVPGGTAFASVGIVASILGFDDTATALFLAIFALQDSFGTSCNIISDGALSVIVQTYSEASTLKNKKQ